MVGLVLLVPHAAVVLNSLSALPDSSTAREPCLLRTYLALTLPPSPEQWPR